MCAQEAICVPCSLAIFLKHPVMKVGFDARPDFPRLMNEGRFSAGERFQLLLSSWILSLLVGHSLSVKQKAKLLNMNS